MTMDLLMKTRLNRINELSAEALRGATANDGEAAHCAAFLDLSPKDLKNYSMTKGIARMVESITRGVSNFGARDLHRVPEGAGAHVPLAFRQDAAPGFDGLEGECSRAIAQKLGPLLNQGAFYVPSDVLYKRDLTVATGSAGGFLVETTLGSFIEVLRNVSVVFRTGAQRVAGLVGNLVLPKQTGDGTSVWLPTEATQVAETNDTFAQVTGTPKICGIFIDMSRQLLKQISPDVDAAVKRSMAAKVALTVDQAALVGTGNSGQPQGITNTPAIGGTSGTSLAVAGLVNVQTDVADANAILNPATLGYVTTPLVAQLLKARPDFVASTQPVWKGAIHQGTIEGVQALSTNQLPANTMIYGDWSTLVIAEWGTLMVEVDPFTKFTSGIVGVRSLWTDDVLVQHPSAFTLISSIT
jgi:HK97 family phage major capsid protein